jgi:hypothetical protein
MKRYINADNSGYSFYVDDCLDNYDYFNVTIKSKDMPEFVADAEVTVGGANGYAVDVTDYFNEGDLSDEEFDEVVDNEWESIEEVVADYLYDNELVYMDTRGFTHKVYH